MAMFTAADILEEFAQYSWISRDHPQSHRHGGSSWEGIEYSIRVVRAEAQRQSHRRWASRNKRYLNEAEKRRYQENPVYRQRKLATQAKWKASNKEKQAAYSRKHFLANREAKAEMKRALRRMRALSAVNDAVNGMPMEQVMSKYGVARRTVLIWLSGKGSAK